MIFFTRRRHSILNLLDQFSALPVGKLIELSAVLVMDTELSFNQPEFIGLLATFISHSEKLQNAPPSLVPTEALVLDEILKILEPYIEVGQILFKKFEYTAGRPNAMFVYGEGPETVSFIGSHLDVVPADKEQWTHDPFKLTIKDDRLYGRGTTDCLGHVALLTLMLKQLAERKIETSRKIVVLFIADEEVGTDPTIGVKQVHREGQLDFIKSGPVYWVDSSGMYPTVGSGSGLGWQLKVTGKKGHTGFPENAINPIMLGHEAIREILNEFNRKFPPDPRETEYGFKCSSNMKPTKIVYTENNGINQFPAEVTFLGDVRATPFYSPAEIMSTISDFVTELNSDITKVPTFPNFSYSLSDGTTGKLEFSWIFGPYSGIACNMESHGFKALKDATTEVMGDFKTFAELGSLPLVSDLAEDGFDVQIIGYGETEAYHANDEYCLLSNMEKGFKIIGNIIQKMCFKSRS